MQDPFYYAAASYLDEWMRKDRDFYETLGHRFEHSTPVDKGPQCLVDIATYYSVIRNFKMRNEPRLQAAFEALIALDPPVDETVVETVKELAGTLQDLYGKYVLSASSKFLWMRFRSPVVIYDSIVARYLCANCGYKDDGYANYRASWLLHYRECEKHIRHACTQLAGIKRFTLASEVPDELLSQWTSSSWFAERVFDHFMQIDRIRSSE